MRGWRGPRYPGEVPTLGYHVLNQITATLPSPLDSTQPLVLTDRQAEITLRWYAIGPLTGHFIYRRAILEEAKGWGKSPFAAAIALMEFAGEVCFDGWDADGEPVACPWGYGERPPPWVQIAAVSEDQTDNTYSAGYEMLTANGGWSAIQLGIDQGRTRLYLRNRPGRLEPVTASAGSREGQRTTFDVLDETHLWTAQNGGRRLAGTLRRNAAKMGGRTFETTNAPVLGEKSVAEQTETVGQGVLHLATRPSVEPSIDWPPEKLLVALGEVYKDAPWVSRERLLNEIADPEAIWQDTLRYYFNVRTAGAGRAIDPRLWDLRAAIRDVPSGTAIGLGFDGSISQDATVLRGCTADGYSFLIRHWVRPRDARPDWTVDRTEVEETIAETFGRYTVGKMLCDPPKWWTEISRWALLYGENVVEALDTNQPRRFAPAVDRWLTGIRGGTHTHDADPLTDLHVKASHLRKVRLADSEDDSRTMYVLIKGEDHGRIDAAVADVLAHEAAMTMDPIEGPSVYETRGLKTLRR